MPNIIAMPMIKKASNSNLKNAAILAEFTVCHSAIGRGGKHVFLWWDERIFDPCFKHQTLIGL